MNTIPTTRPCPRAASQYAEANGIVLSDVETEDRRSIAASVSADDPRVFAGSGTREIYLHDAHWRDPIDWQKVIDGMAFQGQETTP